MYDAIVIGGGIVGCCVARELSKYDIRLALIEKEIELSMGASKANSGIVHAGFDCNKNTLKALLNVKGSQMFPKLAKDLDIPFKNNGSLVLAFNEEEKEHLEELLEKGIANGVCDLEIISKEEVLKLEPNVSENVFCALHAKTGGVVSPYEAVQAFAENAFENGCEFYFNEEVLKIEKNNESYKIYTKNNSFETKTIINCAGIYSDEINNMISENKYFLQARKGEYMLFDNTTNGYVTKTIFQVPTKVGKGVLVTPTVHGNLLIGPSSEFINEKDDTQTHRETLLDIQQKSLKTIKSIPYNKLITSFTGLRATEEKDDFIIEESKDNKGFINAIGINSPGLTSAPAIAEYISNILKNTITLNLKHNFIEKRTGIKFIRDLDENSQDELIKENHHYGKIVCRCETVTEGEILDSIRRPLGAKTLDGVKRLTRSGMGRCQGGFCSSKIIDILAEELNTDVYSITKFGRNSNIL